MTQQKDNNIIINNKMEEDSKMSSSIMRKCQACGKIIDRKKLIRILKEYKTGEIIINPNNKQFGKSFYICKNIECFKLAQKKKWLKNLSEEKINKILELLS